ncbi:hypothetical protein [Bifidobacterium moukalabense]|uniref:hypothetical protein n=1 Tax=Bifidobacterium moukalabense TaxID=1333651 RepID=UPI0010F512BA|nr:hypothetical protein [Bifidobacterium moukalabense]
MRRRLKGLAALAALLILAGCGSAGAQTTTAKSAEPENEAAEFGENLAALLNSGKSKKLFDLWTGSDDLTFEPLVDAVMPDAKAKGIKWEYKSGDFSSQEGSVTLKWTTAKRHSSKEYKVKKVDGEWRLETEPLTWVDVCLPFSVDGTDAPVIEKLDQGQGPCFSDGGEEGSVSEAGQILLVPPGEHSFSLDSLKNVIEQPYKTMVYPTYDATIDFSKKPGIENEKTNLIPNKPALAAGYADAVKAAFLVAKNDVIGDEDNQHPDLFDGITVTPTDDIMNPSVSGTYQHWTKDGYQPRDISGLNWEMSVGQEGIIVTVHDIEATGI